MAFILKKLNEQESDAAAKTDGKYCALVFCGLKIGPYFIECDKNGKIGSTGKIVTDISDKMRGMFASGKTPDGKAMQKVAEDAGWTVVKNDYIEGQTAELNESILNEAADQAVLDDLKRRMLAGVVHFKYRKVGKPAKVNKRTGEITPEVPGEEREAFGTLCEALVQRTERQIEQAAASHKIPNPAVMTYFDIHAVNHATGVEGDWRCFRKENFIEIIED